MATNTPTADAPAFGGDQFTVHSIGPSDLKEALVRGLADFNAMPTHVIYLCLIYPLVTLVFARAYSGHDVLPLVFPLLAGYTLVGPLVAIGTYELSRRREQGLDHRRRKAFHVLQRQCARSIGLLGVILMLIYFLWLVVAWGIYSANFGDHVAESVGEFILQILTTAPGWSVIIVGSCIGFFFAVVVFSLSVVSFPLILDRNVGVMTAMQTSVRAVIASPVTMAMWGLIVAGVMLLGSLPVFVGLCVALPVLGHATWHIYRMVVEHE